MFKFLPVFFLTIMAVLSIPGSLMAAEETDVYENILEKVDGLVCIDPEKISNYYSSKLVIMTDDKRGLLENRIKSYRQMMSDFRDLKCQTQRKVLAGKKGKEIGYALVDEISSVTSKSNDTDERQHNVCSYLFVKESGDWKISLEHCSSLPDYSINPEDDALYYFHNPIY
jgi:hypothetical protein